MLFKTFNYPHIIKVCRIKFFAEIKNYLELFSIEFEVGKKDFLLSVIKSPSYLSVILYLVHLISQDQCVFVRREDKRY